MTVISCCYHITWQSTCSSLWRPSSMHWFHRCINVLEACPVCAKSDDMTNLLPWNLLFCVHWTHSCTDIVPFHIAKAYQHKHPCVHSVCIKLTYLVTMTVTVGSICMPSLWKHNRLLMLHWSIHLQSLGLLWPFFLVIALFTRLVYMTFPWEILIYVSEVC
jgi:hypothetical protein